MSINKICHEKNRLKQTSILNTHTLEYTKMPKTCLFDGCKKIPYFNTHGTKTGIYCANHKIDGMVNVISKTCLFDGCKKIPSFNNPREKTGLYCKSHKLDGMVDVIHQTCLFDGCKKIPYFNTHGTKTGIYCANHKIDGMVNVISKTCLFDGCKTRPTFNTHGTKTGIFCANHKLDGMVDVIHQTCLFDGCKKIPSFNNPGDKTGLYCSTHKIDGMVNVIDRTCRFDGCNTQPMFNNPGEKTGLYCYTHKIDGMVNVISKTCQSDGCKIIPSYNNPGEKTGLYCKSHKVDGMVDVKNKSCLLDGCDIQVQTSKYNGYCLRCAIYMAPETVSNTRNYKTKEKHVVDELIPLLNNLNLDIAFDKRIVGDLHIFETGESICCDTLRRPDILIDRHTHCIIVEIDEKQHKGYSCENARVVEIFQALGMRPIILLRFNPDSYINANKERIKSCFDYNNQREVPKITSDTQKDWDRRIKTLNSVLKGYIESNDIPKKEITIDCLFYDGSD